MDNDEAFNAALDSLAAQMNERGAQEWLMVRKKAGQDLDPETADMTCSWTQTADPYGVSRGAGLCREGVFRSIGRQRHVGLL